MTEREKLIELLQRNEIEFMDYLNKVMDTAISGDVFERIMSRIEFTADHLIANGVTVQEWISVTERLPKAGEDVLVAVHDGYDSWVDTDEALKDGGWLYFGNDRIVTHWMPLPEPPKGD